MEDEGIMALPQGQEAMQNQGAPAPTTYVSSADSYDAALTALGLSSNDPVQAQAVRQAVRESINELELSPEEVASLLDVLEYMSQNPEEYPQLRQQLLDAGMMDEDDLPEQYDPVFLGVAIMALNEYQGSKVAGAEEAMQMAPEVEGLGPLPMAEGGLADMARVLASKGRNGDTMLAHITPAEARLLKRRGGAGTINPFTGLPEFFLKKLFKSVKKAVKKVLKNPIFRVIATVALATVLGPAAAAVAGKVGIAMSTAATAAAGATLSSAAVSAMAGEKINAKNLLITAATSYFGAGGNIGRFTPGTDIATKFGLDPTSAIGRGVASGVTGTGIGLLAGMSPEEALKMGATQGLTAAGTQAFQNWRAGQPTQAQTQPVEGGGQQLIPESPPDVASGMGGDMTPPPGAAAPTTPTTAVAQVGAAPPGAVGTATEVPATPSRPGFLSNFREGLSKDVPVDAATGLPVPAQTMAGRLGQAVAFPSLTTAADALLFNPYAQTELGKFAPAALTTLGIGALTGGFKSEPVNESPLFDRQFTGLDYMRQNPGMFSGSLGRIEGMPPAYNPVVPYSTYSQMQTAARPTTPTPVVPRTTPPAGVVPPANIAGRMSVEELAAYYGLPELASPVPQPVYMATGGAVNDPTSADYWFDEFRRSGSTLDDAALRQVAEQRAAQFRTPLYTSSSTTPAGATTAATTTPSSGVRGNFGGSASTAPYNPAVPTMPERTAVRRTRAEMTAPVVPLPPPLPKARLNHQNVSGLYGVPDLAMSLPQAEVGGNTDFYNRQNQQPRFMNQGGQPTHFPRKTGPINGPGTGTSDSIPAMLSDGEFVFTAKAVRNAGGGSRRKGAKRMYALMKKLEGGLVKGNA